MLLVFAGSMSINAQVMRIMQGYKVVGFYTADQADNVMFLDSKAEGTVGTAKRTGDVDVIWIQLWENGPKFAQYNIGAIHDALDDWGGYFFWGKSINQDPTGSYKEGNDPLTGDDDTATNLWGSNWRMPTYDEFQALIANCDFTWTTVNGLNGALYTGRGIYSGNSVFFPAVDCCDNTGQVTKYGDAVGYWSSTPCDMGAISWSLYADDTRTDMWDTLRDTFGLPVRAVLNE